MELFLLAGIVLRTLFGFLLEGQLKIIVFEWGEKVGICGSVHRVPDWIRLWEETEVELQ